MKKFLKLRHRRSSIRCHRLCYNEKSPYLLQHAHNPVDWFPWGEEAFAKAKADDKPLFVSIGYSCCHWCHVHKRYYALIPSLFISKKEY